MLILALDIATTTGWAVYDTARDVSAIRAGAFKVQGDEFEHKAADMGLSFARVVKDHRPDFVAIERPRRDVQQHEKKGKQTTFHGMQDAPEMTINPNSVILPNQLTGAVMAVLAAFKLPWVSIHEEGWRKQFLGFGRKKGWTKKDYKRAVRERCDMLGIVVTNDDMADAVGVAFSATGTDAYRDFLRRHNDRAKVAA